MKRFFFAAAAALSLAACADAGSPVEARSAAGAGPSLAIYGARDSIYTSQTPTSTLSALPDGWEVGTQFTPDYDGRVVGFRFWKAVGECGTHTARLWSPGGSQLASGTFTETASGWQRVSITGVSVAAGTTYRVSVNTNCYQVKDFGYFTNNGPIFRNWGYADAGFYGQPIGSRPTTQSASSFFVDVYFRPLLCDEVIIDDCM